MLESLQSEPTIASPSNEPLAWDLTLLRKVRYEPTQSVVFARQAGRVQRMYPFEVPDYTTLTLRRVDGFPFSGSASEFVWLDALSENGSEVTIAVAIAYIHERTRCLITPQILESSIAGVVNFVEIIELVVSEMCTLLRLQIRGLLENQGARSIHCNSYFALDHNKYCKALILATPNVLNLIETDVQNYCSQYWRDHRDMGQRIRFKIDVCINTAKRFWGEHELKQLEVGDLVRVQEFHSEHQNKRLRGTLRLRSRTKPSQRYEVFLDMNEQDTQLMVGSGVSPEPAFHEPDTAVAPHEKIELEVYAGKTTILFNDLCSVQAGTLIELQEHALPFVTLSVMGSPILEGELVHFQDQLMIQVTKRLG
nr:FliM/FliN family flagellar motor switch protein [uncultured Limnobacter sp.]